MRYGIVRSPKPLLFFIAIAISNLTAAQAPVGVNTQWDRVSEADLKATSPVVDKDAGAEALFWRVHVLDERVGDEFQRSLYHYVRLKVFNEKGKEAASTIDIPFGEKTSILYISARTIRPDGTITEMKKDAIHKREIVRVGKLRQQAMSFTVPGVEPGVIVEYRWQELRHNAPLYYLRLQMQREYPVRSVTYYVRPLGLAYDLGYKLLSIPFNCRPSPMKLEHNGFSSTTLENVPAFKEEPMMPAEPNVRPWILAFYSDKLKREPESYWNDVAKEKYKELKQRVKLSNEVKQAAEKAVQGAGTDEERTLALIRYIRKNLRDFFDASVTEAERNKWVKSNPKDRYRNSAETFELGFGTPDELNALFAAMAQHVGLEARPALVASRNDLLFFPQLVEKYFLDTVDVAIKFGEKWRLYDVSTRLHAPEMLSWQEEGITALVSDPKKASFIITPISGPEASQVARTGRLTLDESGTLSGSVEERYTGHKAHEERRIFSGKSDAKNEERIKEAITQVFPRAEVTDVKLLNADDSEQPFVLKYTVSIASYAQRTGKRLFFQPMLFERGDAPMFQAAERTHDIHFQYAWKENDDITIELPTDFELDNAESPGDLNFGAPGSYSAQFSVKGLRTLQCKRTLVFGKDGMIGFPKTSYGTVKKVFDEIHRRDGHTLSLKQGS